MVCPEFAGVDCAKALSTIHNCLLFDACCSGVGKWLAIMVLLVVFSCSKLRSPVLGHRASFMACVPGLCTVHAMHHMTGIVDGSDSLKSCVLSSLVHKTPLGRCNLDACPILLKRSGSTCRRMRLRSSGQGCCQCLGHRMNACAASA